ncbi:MAG: hypothetical protein QM750_18060 [Rubrivivax sp.]
MEPAHTLFIDDDAANVAAARALGWQALRFNDAAACGSNAWCATWRGRRLPTNGSSTTKVPAA